MHRLTLFLAFMLATGVVCAATGEFVEPARQGDRLDISNYAGEIHVDTWDQDSVRIRAEHRKGEEILLTRQGSVIRVRSDSWNEASDSLEILDSERARLRLEGNKQPGVVLYRVTVPEWLPIQAGGATSSVFIDGIEASVDITSFQGEIRVRRVAGSVSVRCLGGSVLVEHTVGNLRIRNWQGATESRRTTGELTVESTSGDISILDHEGGGVEAVTVAGTIVYEGALPTGEEVSLATHSGDLRLSLPEDTDAGVSVRSVRGSFESAFPVGDRRGKSFKFQIGSGRDPLDLESFSGLVRLDRR